MSQSRSNTDTAKQNLTRRGFLMEGLALAAAAVMFDSLYCDSQPIRPVALDDLLATPEKYLNKDVILEGFVTLLDYEGVRIGIEVPLVDLGSQKQEKVEYLLHGDPDPSSDQLGLLVVGKVSIMLLGESDPGPDDFLIEQGRIVAKLTTLSELVQLKGKIRFDANQDLYFLELEKSTSLGPVNGVEI